jgi:hypothetical protein
MQEGELGGVSAGEQGQTKCVCVCVCV